MSCVDDSGDMLDGSGTYRFNIGTACVCSVGGGVPGSLLDGVVCLSVIILSIISVIVLILMRLQFVPFSTPYALNISSFKPLIVFVTPSMFLQTDFRCRYTFYSAILLRKQTFSKLTKNYQ